MTKSHYYGNSQGTNITQTNSEVCTNQWRFLGQWQTNDLTTYKVGIKLACLYSKCNGYYFKTQFKSQS